MKIPWIVYAGALAQGLPILMVLILRPPLSTAKRWVLAWCTLLVIGEAVTLTLSLQNQNNHWFNYLVTPVAAAMALWALSHWQASPLAALSFRLTVPLLGLAWVAMVVTLENTATFSLLAEPFAGLLVLGAAVYTLVSRTVRENGKLTRQEWLWVALGLALNAGAGIALPPAARWLVQKAPDLLVRAYEVKAVFVIAAMLAIARGMVCPIPVLRSGGSSSRASSPSRSSWSGSSSPS